MLAACVPGAQLLAHRGWTEQMRQAQGASSKAADRRAAVKARNSSVVCRTRCRSICRQAPHVCQRTGGLRTNLVACQDQLHVGDFVHQLPVLLLIELEHGVEVDLVQRGRAALCFNICGSSREQLRLQLQGNRNASGQADTVEA